MKKILITGIHGFVGSNIVANLRYDYDIYGLDIVFPDKDGICRTFSWKDLDDGLVPTVDAIIHLAGKATDLRDNSVAEDYFKLNTVLTKKIFDYFTEHTTVRKFIFFSSVKAVADSVVGEMLREDVEPQPVGPYGESKLKAETYIMDKLSCDSNLYVGRDIFILRPSIIHGPGCRNNIKMLYRFVKTGLPWPLGAFENRRSFTSIDNLIFIVSGLLSKSVGNGIYNVADDRALSTNELVEIICSVTGRKFHRLYMSKMFIKVIAKIGDILHLSLNTARLGKLTESYVVSNNKVKKALSIDRLPVDAIDGLKKTIISFGN